MNIKKILKYIVTCFKIKNEIPIITAIDKEQLLQGKTAFITGGTGGIGREITISLLKSGCNVIVSGTNQTKMNLLLKEFPQYSSKIAFVKFDLNQFELYDDIVKIAINKFGKIDILICSAGVHSENYSFFEMNMNEYDRVLNINLKSTYFISQKIAQYMVKNKIHGHILFISSSRGTEPAYTPYGISKWALEGYTKGLAKELIKNEIIVNAVAPGSTATELIGIKKGDSIYSTENMAGRLILPEEVANLVNFLVSSQSNMIIGETIHISGGRGVIDIR